MTKAERERLSKLLDQIEQSFEEYAETLEDDSDFYKALLKAKKLVEGKENK